LFNGDLEEFCALGWVGPGAWVASACDSEDSRTSGSGAPSGYARVLCVEDDSHPEAAKAGFQERGDLLATGGTEYGRSEPCNGQGYG